MHAYMFTVLEPVLTHYSETRELYAPGGRLLAEGDTFRFPDLADALERLAAEGPDWIYRGDGGERISEWVNERGGTLSREDLAAYRVAERKPVVASYRGRQVLTTPPPSSGGILIAYALDLLEGLGEPLPLSDPNGLALLAEVMSEIGSPTRSCPDHRSRRAETGSPSGCARKRRCTLPRRESGDSARRPT
jgi:gamma-glutamyltranspeptidase / glutathione hydrolase